MIGLHSVVRCLFGTPDLDTLHVVILHEPTRLYLGSGLVLTDRDHAVRFDDVAAARRFLDRHGSEPCLTPVAVASGAVEVRAAA